MTNEKEINNLTWDVEVLYENIESWEKDLKKAHEMFILLFSYKDEFYKEIDTFKKYYKTSILLDDLMNRLYLYASLNFDTDTTNTMWNKRKNEVISIYSTYGQEISELNDLEIKNVDNIINIISTEKVLQFLIPKYERLKESKKYMLSQEEETILMTLGDFNSTPAKTFTSLNESDYKIDDVLDSDGNKHKLTHSTFSTLLQSKDDVLRKNAYIANYMWYKNHKETYATNLNAEFFKKDKISKIRGFKDGLENSLFDDRSNRKVIESLISSVKEHSYLEVNYLNIYKKLINKEELERWDLNLTPVDIDNHYSLDEQKEIVLKVATVFGGEFKSVVQSAFDQRWIDFESSDNKRSGAYSSGYQRSKKYILLNNQNNFNSLTTLAHELGHSVHSYYASKYNSYEYGEYKIIEAEIASTLYELILFDYLLSIAKTRKEKIFYLVKLINMARGTIIRQSMFAEFELIINDLISEGKQLASDDFMKIYGDLCEEYFAGSVKSNDYWAYEGFSIPHLYYNFYVYKYATGLSSSLAIYSNIKKDYNTTLEQYIEFLKSGSKDTALNNIKNAGIDLENKETYDNAFEQVEQWIETLQILVEEEEKNV